MSGFTAIGTAFLAMMMFGEPADGEKTTTKTTYPPYAKPTLIAHRGASFEAPEHTLAAYSLALAHGADFVEPDLQITKDGVLICMHDTTLERTTNAEQAFPDRGVTVRGKTVWPTASFTLAEIKTLDAGSWKDPKFAGARVPTFQEMIDLVKGKAGIMPETKDPATYGKLGLNMESLVMDILKKNNLDQPGADPNTPIVIQSFSADSLKILRNDKKCKLPLIYLFSSREITQDQLKTVKTFADGVGPNKAVLLARPELVKDAHDLGMSVTVWTCRAGNTGRFPSVKEEMSHILKQLHVDAIFTDNPDQFPRD